MKRRFKTYINFSAQASGSKRVATEVYHRSYCPQLECHHCLSHISNNIFTNISLSCFSHFSISRVIGSHMRTIKLLAADVYTVISLHH